MGGGAGEGGLGGGGEFGVGGEGEGGAEGEVGGVGEGCGEGGSGGEGEGGGKGVVGGAGGTHRPPAGVRYLTGASCSHPPLQMADSRRYRPGVEAATAPPVSGEVQLVGQSAGGLLGQLYWSRGVAPEILSGVVQL